MGTEADAIAELLARCGLPSQHTIEQIAAGTLNRNFRVEVGSDRYFAREHRTTLTREQVDAEHALLAWLAERRLPVVPPLVVDGESIFLIDGHLWSLSRWVDGELVARGTLSAGRAATMGEMHGRLQQVLSTHPRSEGATWARTWDKAASTELLERIAKAASEQAAPAWMQDAIALHRELLAGWDVKPPSHFVQLPVQLVHGDFHDQQILFERGHDTVALVADWELQQCAPRAWELVRSLDFSQLLETGRLAAYLEGYRQHMRLTEAECRLTMEWWWQTRVVGAWAWSEYFLAGNPRIADVLPATAAQLHHLADPAWRDAVTDRFVSLAVL